MKSKHTRGHSAEFIIGPRLFKEAINPLEGIFDNEDVGHLMLDVWSVSEPDRLIANVTLLAEEDLFAVRDIYVDPEWRNRGLISYMLANAQNISGWSRIITGLEWVNVW